MKLQLLCSAVAFMAQAVLPAMADSQGPTHIVGSANIEKRYNYADLNQFFGGVLVKNGTQTSCQLALVNNQAGLVAANCLDYIGNSVNNATKYEVYVSGSPKGKPSKFTSEKISVHANYDPVSLANNIAIIQYNISTSFSWDFTVGINVTEYTDVYFVRRSLKNLTTMSWYSNDVVSVKASDSQCSSWSKVFSENSGDWMCNNSTTGSIFTSKCNVPYGTVYGIMGKTYTLAGVYSHTVVRGDNVCSDNKQLQYYTMFADYFNWVKSTLGYSIRRGTKNKNSSVTVPSDYSMKKPDSITISGYSAIGGDLYSFQGVNSDSVPVRSDDGTAESDDDNSVLSADTALEFGSMLEFVSSMEEPTDASYGDISKPIPATEASNSISRGEIIAIAVCVPSALILIFLGVFFGRKWYKRRQVARSWDPQLETANLRTVALDIAGTTPAAATDAPPRYESIHLRNSSEAFADAIAEVTKSS